MLSDATAHLVVAGLERRDEEHGAARGMREALAYAMSVHVGVVTTEDYYGSPGAVCGAIGDLVTRAHGPESANMECGPFTSGGAYLDVEGPGGERPGDPVNAA